MQWLNEPARWSAREDRLTVTADAGTDFWRTTGYGYVRDNGHLYGDTVRSDFDLSVRVRGAYADQYDQAGAMLWVDDRRWIKTGIEFVDGRRRFSTVITADHSSWAVAALPPGADEIILRITRRGDAVEVRYALPGAAAEAASEPELAALAYLPPDAAVLAGPMCAAPDGPGFEVTFSAISLAAVPS